MTKDSRYLVQLKKIGKRIKILRIQKGITQLELAAVLGMSQTNMSNIECGRVEITISNLLRIREVLGYSMAAFFVDID